MLSLIILSNIGCNDVTILLVPSLHMEIIGLLHSFLTVDINLFVNAIGHVNNIPTMQSYTGISRNTQSKSYNMLCYYRLSVFEISKIMHCGILINMQYYVISSFL